MKRKNDPGYLLPEVIEPENCCICIPIPNDFNHKMAFLGQLDELGYWWNWERDPDKKGREAAAVWRKIVECIREEMDMSGCGCGDDKPTNTRINPETGLYEVSYDGGITWEPDPGSDPRSSGTTFPPVPVAPGDDGKCQAANSVVGWSQAIQAEELQGLENNQTVAEFITALIAALAAVGIFFAFVPSAIAALLAFVVNTFARLIPADFESQFTESTWDSLLCIIYCNISEDGSFTEAQWQTVKTKCIEDIGGYAGYWLHDHINLIGTVGLTNAARSSYAGTRDCDACECSETWCYEFNFTADDGDWDVINGAWSGAGWSGTSAGSGVAVNIFKAGLPEFNLTHIEIDITTTGVANIAVILDDVTGIAVVNDAPSGSYEWDGDFTAGKITLNPSSGAAQGANVVMTRALFSGVGENPFGSDNC